MALFEWTRTGFGRTWKIEIGNGTSANLYVKQWPVLEFVKRPTKKEAGVYPRKLTIPIVDYNSSNGYLREAVFDSELECTLRLNSSAIFSGVVYQSDIIKAVGEDQYDTEIIVSDGLQRLKSSAPFSGTYTYENFLKELLWETGFELPIHFYTDWEEDNAAVGLVDTHRLTYEGDNYMEVLQNFCNDFGYQVYQENNVWVVRSLAYFAGGSATRYVITGGAPSSSAVDLTESITGLYKSSDEDIIRGTGKTTVIFDWPILDGNFVNPTFEEGEEGWEVIGTPPSAGTLNNSSQEYRQVFNHYVKRGDILNIKFNVSLDYSVLDTSTTVRYAQVIFKDYEKGLFYLTNDGTLSSTETTLSQIIETPPISGEDLNVSYNKDVSYGATIFNGKIEIVLQFDSDTGNYNSFTFDNAIASIEVFRIRHGSLTHIAEGASLSSSEIKLNISQNNTDYAESNIEYYDGTKWKPATVWGTMDHGEKRAKDEVIVRNQDMEMIRADMDYASYKGLDKVYVDGDKDFIPLTSKITVGLDDVEVMFVRHERSADVITVYDEFSSNN